MRNWGGGDDVVSIQCSLFLISCVLKQNVCGFVRMRVYHIFFVVL